MRDALLSGVSSKERINIGKKYSQVCRGTILLFDLLKKEPHVLFGEIHRLI